MHKKLKLFVSFFFLFMSLISTATATATTTDEQSLKKLENVKEPGSYPVKVYYEEEGKKLEKNVYMLVTGTYTTIGDNGIAIDASPLSVTIQDVLQFDQADWIRAGKAKAWNTKYGAIEQIVAVNTNRIQATVGSYSITYTTIGGVQTSVGVKVKGERKDIEIMFLKNQQQELMGRNTTKDTLRGLNFNWIQKISLTMMFLFLILIPVIILITQYQYAMKLIKEVLEILRIK
ncbi:hypothetical protein IGL98_003346 [Enterococcus sp. DIV0840]|uniref:hypothetical protein n=1 Tax=Enterococcus TaxID=1350 RepID=UPI001A8FF3A6|nr:MULTISPECIES: hypothetical protein [Enterococcus]MBO0433093.1 hypothetical protein [Enterococcus sp. DIV0849a]MBO0473940.1 hypothetical protein [Enterococcus ureasiticus]